MGINPPPLLSVPAPNELPEDLYCTFTQTPLPPNVPGAVNSEICLGITIREQLENIYLATSQFQDKLHQVIVITKTLRDIFMHSFPR